MNMPGTLGGAQYQFATLTTAQVSQLTSSSLSLHPSGSMKIGFIGFGFVGSAIHEVYQERPFPFRETIIVDPAKGYTNTYKDLLGTDGVFVCVPSPMGKDGTCDTSILEDVLEKLYQLEYTGVIISKVTAPPQVYSKLQKKYKNLVHAPEFLTAARAVQDYMNSKFAIIGGEVAAYRHEAERIIKAGLPNLHNIYHCSIEEASLAKYTINTFLATKVVFMNEIAKLAENLGCDYSYIAKMVNLDERIGTSHMKVPGPDGVYGFGGMCFPKDTAALLKIAEEAGVEMRVLNAAVQKNTFLRLTESK